MHAKILITTALVVCLTACTVTSDPRGGGLFGGMRGIYGGDYDNRIQQRQGQLAEEQKINRDLHGKSETLENDAQLRDRTLASEQQCMSALVKDLSRLESSMNQLRAKSDQQKKEVAKLRLKIEDLRKHLNSQETAISELDRHGGSEANPERYQILQRERDRLSKEYRKLFEYFQALSAANS